MRFILTFLALIPTIVWGQDCQFNRINIEVIGLDSDIGWSIAQDNGWAIISGALGSVSDVCIEDGCFPFTMYDGDGDDGWNETTIAISYFLTNEVIFSGTLNDGFFESINIQIGETELCPVYGCTDPLACNYDADATVQSGSYGDGVLNFEWTSETAFFAWIENSYTVNGVTYFGEEAGDVSLAAGTYTVTGYDSWGDGWNGGELTITDVGSGVSVVLIVDVAEASVDIEVTGVFVGSCTYQEVGYTCDGMCMNDSNGDGICDSLCSEDLSGDGIIGAQDLLLLLSEFGCTSSCENDLNQDGSVAIDDILQLLSGFGNACENTTIENCVDVISHEGYDYTTVEIGDQCWFAENCRFIPFVNEPTQGDLFTPHVYVLGYEGQDVTEAQAHLSYATYGCLYNFAAIEQLSLCPTDWHIPTDDDWGILEHFMGMDMLEVNDTGWRGTTEGQQLKDSALWNGQDVYQMAFLPGSFRGTNGTFSDQEGSFTYHWTSTSESSVVGLHRALNTYSSKVFRNNNLQKSAGVSARCVKD
jgi:uncharacterized protein (TIGR02145 family)